VPNFKCSKYIKYLFAWLFININHLKSFCITYHIHHLIEINLLINFIKNSMMKKVIAVSILTILLVGGELCAQGRPFVFGFKAAPNLGWMNPDTEDYNRDGSKIGFSWGLIAEIHLMENYALNTGINIVFLNGALNYVDDIAQYGGEGELFRKYKFKYLEVPFTLKMKTNEFSNKSFYGIFGFGANLLLSGKSKDKFLIGGNEVNDEQDLKDQLKSFRASLIVGVGAEFSMGETTKLITGINFDNGITDVLKFQNTASNFNHKAINNFLEFYIGVLF
jgi:hypothetical protein